MTGNDRLFTGVHQQEASGAVGVFCHTFLKAALTEQSRLLIACDPGNRDFAVEKMHRRRCRDNLTGRLNLRKHACGDIQLCQDLRIPFQIEDIIHHRSRSVGVIRAVAASFAELPHQPRIDRPHQQLAVFRPLPRARDMIKNPLDFRR